MPCRFMNLSLSVPENRVFFPRQFKGQKKSAAIVADSASFLLGFPTTLPRVHLYNDVILAREIRGNPIGVQYGSGFGSTC